MYPEYFESEGACAAGRAVRRAVCRIRSPGPGPDGERPALHPRVADAAAGRAADALALLRGGLCAGDSELRLGKHPYHHAGAFYLQEPSASAPAALLEVQPGQRVLDLCAAPGGKSSQLAAALAGQGGAGEQRVRARPRPGADEQSGTDGPGELGYYHRRHRPPRGGAARLVRPGAGGRALLRRGDVPQGAPGRCPSTVPLLWPGARPWARRFWKTQRQCWPPGGLLVYSTCTFAPEEDEGQVGRFLALHPEFELLDCGVSFGAPGEENRCGEHSFPAGLTRRIWPAQGGEGHFMAKLRKSPDAPAAVSKRAKPARPPKPCAEWLAFAAEYIPALKGQSAQAAGERLFLPPQGWQGEGLKLSIARCGVTLGRVQKGRFEPDHHLFMAFGPECENREELTLGDERTEAWLRGEEIRGGHREKRLVRRAGGRPAPGRGQGERRPGEEPLPQSPAESQMRGRRNR